MAQNGLVDDRPIILLLRAWSMSIPMSPLDHFPALTGVRDADALCGELAAAFFELFHAQAVAIHRPVGNPDDQRWATWSHAAPSNSWEFDRLPPMHQFPERCAAQKTALFVVRDAGVYISMFPVTNGLDSVDVLEMSTPASLDSGAQHVADILLRVYTNMRRLLDYGQRDSLTGLLNRKTFDDAFFSARTTAAPQATADERRAERDATRHWVGMIDIDFFKSVNDRFGHLIGDEVLLLVAHLLRASCRPHDLIYRFGGEEFVVLLKCPLESDAARVFERLRNRIGSHRFPQVGEVTVSIGFTEMLAGDSPAAALGRADRAVYFVKGNGRNQVQSYAGLVGQDNLQAEAVGEIELF